MSAYEKSSKLTPSSSGVVVSNSRNRSSSLFKKRTLFPIGGVLFVLIVGALVFALLHNHKATNKTKLAETTTQAQKAVDNSISYASNPASLKAQSSIIINGGVTSTVSKAQLAQAYAARGDAESNSQEYVAANADYTSAQTLDPRLSDSLAYREFYVRYKSGQRKTLIPLLQQMIKSLSATSNDFAGSTEATYQQYIQDLQNGQDLPL